MNILIFLFTIITLQLCAADQVVLKKHMRTLPAELIQEIISDIALTNAIPSQYAVLRDAKDEKQRQQFYVDHLLIALHFWNTDLMHDIVGFEIGRFRKRPELIFALDKDRWERDLICANYIKRTAKEEQYQAFINKFQLHMGQIKGQEYRLFLPQQNFSYIHPEFLVKKYCGYRYDQNHLKRAPLSFMILYKF